MSNFAYAATRARARRARLLPPEAFRQLLNMELEEIARYIQDLEYRREIDRYGASLRGADLLEAALLDNRAAEVGEIIGFCTGELRQGIEAYAEIYRVRGIKVLLRGIFDGLGGEKLLRQVSPRTERDRELYTQMAATNSIEAAVELLEGTRYHDVVQNALEQRQSDSLQPIEDALDRAYYENLVSSLPAGGAAGRVYRGFVQTQIDVTNLKTVMRLRHRGLTGLGELLIEGGTLDESALATTSSVADILPIIEGTTFQEVLQPVLEDFEDGGLNRAVQALENHVATQSRRYAYLHPLSILPILDYLLRKEKEVRNLRTIVRGRELELSREKIEELLVV
jgi:V/A-type H+-transporting ATPase subunit C